MAVTGTNAHLRARSRFARWLRWMRPRRAQSPPLPKSLSDHLARDIGLDPAELERLRLQWPSQKDRPNL